MTQRPMHIETKVIHAGEPEPRIGGAVTLPIFQSSTFQYTGQDNYDELKYIRMNNTPTHVALHQKISALENAEAGLVAASGMAAITTTFLALLSPGDHFLAQDDIDCWVVVVSAQYLKPVTMASAAVLLAW